jgi:hypothetical protein
MSEPVPQVLFEVHASLPDVAERAIKRLTELGPYEFQVMHRESWAFGPTLAGEALLENLGSWGDVHARLVDA